MRHLLWDVMILSTPLPAGVTKDCFPPSCFSLHTSLCRADFRCSCQALWLFSNWVSPWSTSRKMVGFCIQKPPAIKRKLCFSWCNCNWEDMGRAWLTSQSHSGKLESGEPPCLPLLSQRALFVTCYHRLSRHRVLWPHTLLSCIFPFWPSWHNPLLHIQHLKGETSSFSPHTVLKGPSPPEGPLLFLWQSICSTLAFVHLPICLSSSL